MMASGKSQIRSGSRPPIFMNKMRPLGTLKSDPPRVSWINASGKRCSEYYRVQTLSAALGPCFEYSTGIVALRKISFTFTAGIIFHFHFQGETMLMPSPLFSSPTYSGNRSSEEKHEPLCACSVAGLCTETAETPPMGWTNFSALLLRPTAVLMGISGLRTIKI